MNCDVLLQCFKTNYLEKEIKQIVTKSPTFADLLVAIERQYPSYETDLSIRTENQNLAMLPKKTQGCAYVCTTGQLGPLGRASDARILRQRQAALLVRDQDSTRRVG